MRVLKDEGRQTERTEPRGRVKAGRGGIQAGSELVTGSHSEDGTQGGEQGGCELARPGSQKALMHLMRGSDRSSGWGSTSDPGGGGPTMRLGVGVGVGTRSN